MTVQPKAAVSFANDIRPNFVQYQANMRWRLDLADYDQVKANADQIYGRMRDKSMPPPPFSPFSDSFIKTFKAWMAAGCAP